MNQQLITDSISTFLYVARQQELTSLGAHHELVAALDRLNAAFDSIPSEPMQAPLFRRYCSRRLIARSWPP